MVCCWWEHHYAENSYILVYSLIRNIWEIFNFLPVWFVCSVLISTSLIIWEVGYLSVYPFLLFLIFVWSACHTLFSFKQNHLTLLICSNYFKILGTKSFVLIFNHNLQLSCFVLWCLFMHLYFKKFFSANLPFSPLRNLMLFRLCLRSLLSPTPAPVCRLGHLEGCLAMPVRRHVISFLSA